MSKTVKSNVKMYNQVFSFALCRALFDQRQDKHPASVFLRNLKRQFLPNISYSDVYRFILPRMCTSDPSPTALSDVYRLFTASGHLAIQVACFNALLDCFANMIVRLLDLHIVESTPCD